MDTGFYNAAIKMASGSIVDMEVCAENLANVTMPGYKRINTMHAPFSDVLSGQVNEDDDTSHISLKIDHEQGALNRTGNPLDFALDGDGFFVYSDGDDKEYLSRNGHCHLAPDRTVVNSIGQAIQTTSGDLKLPQNASVTQLTIDDSRNIRINGKTIAQLKVQTVENLDDLQKAGNTMFSTEDVELIESDANALNQFLEQSNTAIFEELVGMMTTLRNYEACQKMMQSVDRVGEKMMSKLVK